MAYSKQNFKDGQTLTAAHLIKIEEAILQNEKTLEDKQPKGEYVTTEYIVGVFEELKALIQAGNTEAAIATLDNAILDMHVLA